MRSLVLFSEEMDSLCCIHRAMELSDDVTALLFNYGQRNILELKAAEYFCRKYRINRVIFDIRELFKHLVCFDLLNRRESLKHEYWTDTKMLTAFVPGRNAIFLSVGCSMAVQMGCQDVYFGITEARLGRFPDSRRGFAISFQKAFNRGLSCERIRIKIPFWNKMKSDLFELAQKKNFLDDMLRHSFSCYNNVKKMNPWGWGCRKCTACVGRRKGWNEFQKTKSGN